MRKTLPQRNRILARLKLLVCDVDGVLTDGGIVIGGATETKRFHIPDGLGLLILQRNGVKLAWVSNRPSAATELRARELGIDYLRQQKGSKVEIIEALLQETGFNWSELGYIGDDVVDLGAMRRAGFAVAVSNGISETKALADYVTRRRGGEGAVREVVELILKAKNRWRGVVKEYSK